jgi:hypothetical protein
MTRVWEHSSSGWSLWRSVCVRGAGFPASDVLELAAPGTAVALDRMLDQQAELKANTAAAIAALEAEIGVLPRNEPRRATMIGHLRPLRAGVAVEPASELSSRAASAVVAHNAGLVEHQRMRLEAGEQFARDYAHCVSVLQATCRDPRFREAVRWQNPRVLRVCDTLLRQDPFHSNAQNRKDQRLITSYLQRYCLKNDTISFFGPLGWATLGTDGEPSVIRCGRNLLATRTVYFEHWAIEALAACLAADPLLRPHLRPRRSPTIWLEGNTLHVPWNRRSELPEDYARVLAACDGKNTARLIALEVMQDARLGISSEDEVFGMLDELANKKLVMWTLEIPTHVEHPDRVLASLLESVDPPDAAASALAHLAELRAARDSVAGSAGDSAALDVALTTLDETFTRITGAASSRRGGETYAGRTLVYEDCRRDIEMTISPAVLERIAGPLSLVLQSARWFTFEIARRYRDALIAIHRQLSTERGSPVVDFLSFWRAAYALFSGDSNTAPPLVTDVVSELQQRWGEVFGFDDDSTRARRRLEVPLSAMSRAREVFAAPNPGWPSARHHSPDLLIAARSADAFTRGEYLVVAGEFHVALATVVVPSLARQHPDPGELVKLLEGDRVTVCVEPVVPKENATRSDLFSLHSRDLGLELGATASWRPRSQVLEAGSLVVEPAGDSVRVRSRIDGRTFALEQVFDHSLSAEGSSRFPLFPESAHTPRVTIDGFVLQRETWRFDSKNLDFLHVDDPLDRMLALRRWARAHELPRFVFYKVPEETKPCYLDLDSPHFIELFVHLARKASSISVSEMLPSVDEVWLPDAEGKRYTCELRIVAVDPVAWPDPGMSSST